jgi:predicted phage terminase large subunit-like protein
MKQIKPQDGPQYQFLSCSADIVFYGGEAGGGKSFGILMDPTRFLENGKVSALILRREVPQIKQLGGLWEKSFDIYKRLGGKPNLSDLVWTFPSGFHIKFSGLEYDNTAYKHDGSQIPILYFDELRHFSEFQFYYMISRVRTTSGIKPYIRATTNPEPSGWLRDFVNWYIGKDGYAIFERSGVIRYFVRINDQLEWGDTKEELVNRLISEGHKEQDILPRSFTFIHASLSDNPELMKQDPNYRANILMQNKVEKERLLGNWNARGQAGDYFKKEDFEEIEEYQLPTDRLICRATDRAATEKKDGKTKKGKTKKNDPDATSSIKMSRDRNGIYYIEDFSGLKFIGPTDVDKLIFNTATQDGVKCHVVLSQDPNQAGKFEIEYYIKRLAKFKVATYIESGDKEVRAAPFSAQVGHGNVKVVKGPWNKEFYKHYELFPSGRYKDPIDAGSGAFNYLTITKQYDRLTPDINPNENTQNIDLSNKRLW